MHFVRVSIRRNAFMPSQIALWLRHVHKLVCSLVRANFTCLPTHALSCTVDQAVRRRLFLLGWEIVTRLIIARTNPKTKSKAAACVDWHGHTTHASRRIRVLPSRLVRQ